MECLNNIKLSNDYYSIIAYKIHRNIISYRNLSRDKLLLAAYI
jgi:hypothetical protein